MCSMTVLVGREADLTVLGDAFDRVTDGSAATVLVGGEAGIGKTRLVQEFAARVADRGRVLAGSCVERGADGLPFAPFTAALRGLVTSLGPARVAQLLPSRRLGELPRVLPALGELDAEADTSSASARLFEQMLMLLGGLAAQQPTVLVIEDAHWAATTSRALLDFLVRNQQAAPTLLIVVTYRSADLGPTHALRTMLAELDRIDWVTRRELGRLTQPDVARQIESILNQEPAPELVDDIYRRSDGNPLFVEALLAGGTSGDNAVPESLRDLLLTPIRRLPDDAREVVRVAAVGGVRVGHDLLATVAQLQDEPLSDALRVAVAANTLEVERDSYVFRHALIREAVYADQLPGDRVRTHLHYAEALEANSALAPDGRAAIELAHHWNAAGDLPRALNAAWRAAAEAEASLAYSEQLHMLTRVLELWPRVNAPDDRIGVHRLAVLERAVEAAQLAGEAEQGVRLASTALTELQSEPTRAARMLELRSSMLRALGREGDLDDLREAIRLAPDDSSRARVLAALAARLLRIPQHDEARPIVDEALELARRSGDAHTEALALVLAATVRARFGHLASELPRLHEAQRIAESIGAYDRLMEAMYAEADLLEAYGEHERAVEVARRGIVAATEMGMARSLGGPHSIHAASSLISLGRWEEALNTIDAALQLAPPPIVRAELTCQRATIGLARGDTELPRNAIAIARGVSDAGSNIFFPTAELEIGLLLLEGNPAEAFTVVERTLADHDVQASSRFGWPFLVLAARVAGEVAGDVRARALLTQLHVYAEKIQLASPVQRAHQITFQGEAARAEGRPDRATWDSAMSVWDQLRQPYRLAQALLGAAEAAIAADNDRTAATAFLQRAAELADGLGAVPLRAAVDRLARRARLPLAAAGGHTEDPIEQVRTRLGLTSRELEVLRLVAAGRSNRDIAAELFISAKTASVHLSHILAKLGLANRTEAAATAHRLGLD
jgi:DNA-binding CsgD family transcriptional regulator